MLAKFLSGPFRPKSQFFDSNLSQTLKAGLDSSYYGQDMTYYSFNPSLCYFKTSISIFVKGTLFINE